jgi:hypothetical protein
MKRLLVNVLLPRIGPRERGRHHEGLPPELTDGEDHRVPLSHPAILAIEESPRGQIFLYRYSSDGESVGDTWHQSVEEAIEQAEGEYRDVLGPWLRVPAGQGALKFALNQRNTGSGMDD